MYCRKYVREIKFKYFWPILPNMVEIMLVGNNVSDFLKYLENAKLDIAELYSLEPLQLIVTDKLKNKVLKKASRRYGKYVSKYKNRTGEEPSLNMKANLSYGFLKKVFMEEVIGIVLGWFGITGGNYVTYSNLANRIGKIAEKTHGKALINRIEIELIRWADKYNIKEDLGKIMALIGVKAIRYCQTNFSNIILEPKGKIEQKEEPEPQQ